MVISGFFLNQVLDAHAGIHLGSDGWLWCFLFLLVVLTALALADVRISTRAQLIIGVASVAPILLLLVIVLAKGGDAGVTLAPFDPGRIPSSHGLFLAVVLAFTGFIGFEAAAALGEEAADPLRVIPRAILMAIAVGVVFYILLAWVMAVGFGVDHIDRWATNPAALDTLSSRYAGTWLAVLVDLGVSRRRAGGGAGRGQPHVAHAVCHGAGGRRSPRLRLHQLALRDPVGGDRRGAGSHARARRGAGVDRLG